MLPNHASSASPFADDPQCIELRPTGLIFIGDHVLRSTAFAALDSDRDERLRLQSRAVAQVAVLLLTPLGHRGATTLPLAHCRISLLAHDACVETRIGPCFKGHIENRIGV